jgi:hypothetical protein
MKLGLSLVLGLVLVACAPASTPFDAHPAQLGQRWDFEANDARTRLGTKAIIVLNGERSTQGTALVLSGEVNGLPAGIAYDPKQQLLFSFTFLKLESTIGQSVVAYCFVPSPFDTRGRTYSGSAVVDVFSNIINNTSSFSAAKPDSCRFSLQTATASSRSLNAQHLELTRLIVAAVER